ncbi:hypothetical protein IQ250_24355 [Pseudanabaenaceae cyanobacterium LEGE 13415]|nr:hypothetical protein [Pseudanabaenaceae cyanobacterium LEGE 13415]
MDVKVPYVALSHKIHQKFLLSAQAQSRTNGEFVADCVKFELTNDLTLWQKYFDGEIESPIYEVDYVKSEQVRINRIELSIAVEKRLRRLCELEGKPVVNVVSRLVTRHLELRYDTVHLPVIKCHADSFGLSVGELEKMIRDGEKIPQPEKN